MTETELGTYTNAAFSIKKQKVKSVYKIDEMVKIPFNILPWQNKPLAILLLCDLNTCTSNTQPPSVVILKLHLYF